MTLLEFSRNQCSKWLHAISNPICVFVILLSFECQVVLYNLIWFVLFMKRWFRYYTVLINYKKENMSYDLDAVSDIFFLINNQIY